MALNGEQNQQLNQNCVGTVAFEPHKAKVDRVQRAQRVEKYLGYFKNHYNNQMCY